METMKNEAQAFISERTNITPKAGSSLVNRAVSVLGKEHSTTRGALSGLIASWSALANDEKTLEADSLEIWYLSDALRVFILPLCDAIDASVKAKQAVLHLSQFVKRLVDILVSLSPLQIDE